MDLIARMLDATDPRAPRSGHRRERRERTTARGPAAEPGRDQPGQPPGIEITRGDQDRPLGGEMPAVVLEHVLPGQPGQVADSAPRVPTQRVCAIDQAAEAQVGPEGRVVQVATQLGADPPRHPADRFRRETPDGSSRRPGAPAPWPGPRRGPDRAARRSRPRASPRHLRSPRPAPRRYGSSVPSSSSRPVSAARPGLASRTLPAST